MAATTSTDTLILEIREYVGKCTSRKSRKSCNPLSLLYGWKLFRVQPFQQMNFDIPEESGIKLAGYNLLYLGCSAVPASEEPDFTAMAFTKRKCFLSRVKETKIERVMNEVCGRL